MSNDLIAKRAKEVPGVGKYEPMFYDEHKLKPKGFAASKQKRYSLIDQAIDESKNQPPFYKSVRLEATKHRPFQQVPLKKESKQFQEYMK